MRGTESGSRRGQEVPDMGVAVATMSLMSIGLPPLGVVSARARALAFAG
jgi:hypothetical protein